MKLKAKFSPWHTKYSSFQQEQLNLIQQYSLKRNVKLVQTKKDLECKQSGKQAGLLQTISNQMQSISPKTQNNIMSAKGEEPQSASFRKRVVKSSLKSHRIQQQQKDTNIDPRLDDQMWRALTISCRDQFKSECARLKKYQNLALQLKTRRSVASIPQNTQKTNQMTIQKFQRFTKQKPILQQLPIKNFIISGHNQVLSLAHQLHFKRKQTPHVVKQKFASLRKKINDEIRQKQNETVIGCSKKVVINGKKQKENLFNVIKLGREINLNNKIL